MAKRVWTRRPSPGYDSAADPSIDVKFERVRAALMPEGPGGIYWATPAVVFDVRRDGDSALFLFSWPDEPLPLALRIQLQDTSEEFYYEGPVGSFEEWIDELAVYVMVSVDTGLTRRAKRIDRGSFVELVGA